MQLRLSTTVTSEDRAQNLLFSASGKSDSIFPGGTFRSEQDLSRRLAFLDQQGARPWLQDFLRKENAFGSLTPAQNRNLDAAGSRQAVFLITGQQPGLGGGPILWLYKAITCSALAKEWSRRLARPVIPIFWVAGDDADLPECNHLELLDEQASRVSGPLSLHFSEANRPIPMSHRVIDPEDFAQLCQRLAPLWKAETLALLKSAYPPGCTLTSGFIQLAQTQLGPEGILFVDGFSPHVREHSQIVLQNAVKDWEAFQIALEKGTQAAEAAGIKTQVHLRKGMIHAFALQKGERHRILPEPQDALHPTEMGPVSLELTHDVFTRPLVAEALFPVLGHVLGPAELRYFAQMSPLFLEITGDMPLLHPRMTVAIASDQALQGFTEQGIDCRKLSSLAPSALRAQLEAAHWQAHPAAHSFANAVSAPWLQDLQNLYSLHFKDPGVMAGFEKKLNHAMSRYMLNLKRMSFNEKAGQYKNLFDLLRGLGNGKGQDRHLYLPTLLQILGDSGLAKLREVVDPVNPDLQWVIYERT